ncbi:MAG: RNA polymerase sigma-70 factor [Bacteroidota bacterium]
MSAPDNKIVASVNEKGVSGYRYIYDNYYASLCSFVFRFSIREAEAEDIVQEVILRLWKSSATFESVNGLTSYLFSAVKNASLNALRDRSRRPKSTDHDDLTEALPGSDRPVEESMIEEEYYRQIHAAINKLNPKRRSIILYSMEGLTNSEIAKKAGVSINTVKTLKAKAYRFLREELKITVLLLLSAMIR